MKESKQSASQFALLGMLTLRPMSGYELRSLIQESIGYFWSESFGQIYPTLKMLATQGLIEPVASNENSGREKQRYAITKQGRRALHEWLGMPPYSAPPRSEMLLKLFFAPEADAADIRAHISELRDREARNSARWELVRRDLKQRHKDHPGLPYWLMTLSYGEKHSQASLDWCSETLRLLSKGENEHTNKGRTKRNQLIKAR